MSPTWDIGIPFLVAVLPAGLFMLIGLFNKGLDRPGEKINASLAATMSVIYILGIIAMAIVILLRFENGFRQLSLRTNGCPPIWRKFVLYLSIACILLFDCLININAAFGGAEIFLPFAALMFIAYVCFFRLAFARL